MRILLLVCFSLLLLLSCQKQDDQQQRVNGSGLIKTIDLYYLGTNPVVQPASTYSRLHLEYDSLDRVKFMKYLGSPNRFFWFTYNGSSKYSHLVAEVDSGAVNGGGYDRLSTQNYSILYNNSNKKVWDSSLKVLTPNYALLPKINTYKYFALGGGETGVVTNNLDSCVYNADGGLNRLTSSFRNPILNYIKVNEAYTEPNPLYINGVSETLHGVFEYWDFLYTQNNSTNFYGQPHFMNPKLPKSVTHSATSQFYTGTMKKDYDYTFEKDASGKITVLRCRNTIYNPSNTVNRYEYGEYRFSYY